MNFISYISTGGEKPVASTLVSCKSLCQGVHAHVQWSDVGRGGFGASLRVWK